MSSRLFRQGRKTISDKCGGGRLTWRLWRPHDEVNQGGNVKKHDASCRLLCVCGSPETVLSYLLEKRLLHLLSLCYPLSVYSIFAASLVKSFAVCEADCGNVVADSLKEESWHGLLQPHFEHPQLLDFRFPFQWVRETPSREDMVFIKHYVIISHQGR